MISSKIEHPKFQGWHIWGLTFVYWNWFHLCQKMVRQCQTNISWADFFWNPQQVRPFLGDSWGDQKPTYLGASASRQILSQYVVCWQQNIAFSCWFPSLQVFKYSWSKMDHTDTVPTMIVILVWKCSHPEVDTTYGNQKKLPNMIQSYFTCHIPSTFRMTKNELPSNAWTKNWWSKVQARDDVLQRIGNPAYATEIKCWWRQNPWI